MRPLKDMLRKRLLLFTRIENSPDSYWASTEGQADYFAAKECMRKVLVSDEKEIKMPKAVKAACREQYEQPEDFKICLRTAKAGEDFGKRDFLLSHYDSEPEEVHQATISLLKSFGPYPDLGYRFTGYPSSQCRTDTFYQGALCGKEVCELGVGARPVCWFSGK